MSADLDFIRIECEVSVDLSVQLAAAIYRELRNFESHFKSTCCQTPHPHCSTNCYCQTSCPYPDVFNQGLSPDPAIVRLHQKPSLPFSFYIDGSDGNVSKCNVGLVIIGWAVNFVEIFHTALLGLIKASLFCVPHCGKVILRTYCLDYKDVRHEILHSEAVADCVILLSARHVLQNAVHSECVRLELKSPLRLSDSGSIARRFDFSTFFRSQLRRCSSFYAYYGGGEMDLDFSSLSAAAQYVAILDNKIHYTQPSWSSRMNKAGLTGVVECVGLIEQMYSLLLLGSYFNAGKGATFGAGFHRLEVF